jgi:deoxyribonuclease-4
MDSALRLHHAGGGNLVFHAGFYQDRSKKSSIDNVIRELTDVREQLDKNGMHDIILRPELTGKASQIGDEKELFYIASCVDRTLPCIDFSHYYARYCADRRFRELFRFIEDKADYYFKDMHCHISGIEFTHKGEKKHLTLTESCMPWKKLIGLLAEYDCNGTVICESPVLEEDALLMKHEYDRNKGMNKK